MNKEEKLYKEKKKEWEKTGIIPVKDYHRFYDFIRKDKKKRYLLVSKEVKKRRKIKRRIRHIEHSIKLWSDKIKLWKKELKKLKSKKKI